VRLDCHTCDVGPGQWCRSKTGRRASALHSARTNLLWLAYGLGRINGAREERVEVAVRVLSQHQVRGEDGRLQARLWSEGRKNSTILGPAPSRIMG
jgi:hypothetical protein